MYDKLKADAIKKQMCNIIDEQQKGSGEHGQCRFILVGLTNSQLEQVKLFISSFYFDALTDDEHIGEVEHFNDA